MRAGPATAVHAEPSADVQAAARVSSMPKPTATNPAGVAATPRIGPAAKAGDSTGVHAVPSSEVHATAGKATSPLSPTTEEPTTTSRSPAVAIPYAAVPRNPGTPVRRSHARPSGDVQIAADRWSASASTLPTATHPPCHGTTARISAVPDPVASRSGDAGADCHVPPASDTHAAASGPRRPTTTRRSPSAATPSAAVSSPGSNPGSGVHASPSVER